jgi:hypothetical protein
MEGCHAGKDWPVGLLGINRPLWYSLLEKSLC